MTSERTRLLFDTTRLQHTGLYTGIQRVVRRLMRATRDACAGSGCEVLPVTFGGAQWQAYSDLAPHPLQGAADSTRAPAVPIEPGRGDTLLLFDASWYADPWPAVDCALESGARVCGMVHDLLPIERPAWFRAGLSEPFTKHLHALASRADWLLVPSQTVADRLLGYLAGVGIAARVEVLAHGGDFTDNALQASSPPDQIRHVIQSGSENASELYLMLGTLEPRKNQALVIDALEALWAQGSSARLVLVGNEGWQVDRLMARLHKHPYRDQRLFHLANLNDPSLSFLLRHADALIYFSSDEGFGLPVLEAAMQQCPVIASDIPVLREVGGSWPHYVPLDQPAALVDALRHRLYERSAAVAPHRTWNDVAHRLSAILGSVGQPWRRLG